MKVVKRSQLAILSLAVMVMIAGYINYKYDPEREKELGQTVYVNSSDIYLYNNDSESVNVYTEASRNDDSLYKTKQSASTIATFKSQRDDMFSELEASYRNTISTSESHPEIVEEYEDKLTSLIEQKHISNLVESMIKSKGIENIAVIPSGEKITVVVKLDGELTTSQIAIIETIVKEQFKVDSSKITIMQER